MYRQNGEALKPIQNKDFNFNMIGKISFQAIISFEVCNSTNLPYLKLPHDFSQLSKDFCKSLKD